MSHLVVSASGTRGVVGETMTPELAVRISRTFGSYVNQGTVVVGGDTRTSTDCLKYAVISSLLSVGCDVIDVGKVPTPTVQQMVRYHQAAGGIVVTASHNPVIWNGIKLMNHQGAFLNEQAYSNYSQLYEENPQPYVAWNQLGQYREDPNAIQRHVDLILTHLDPTPIQNSSLRVLIDPNNGAGAIANPILFEKLGVQYDMINEQANGHFNHPPEPVEAHLADTMSQLRSGKYDIGFVQDADADRLVMLGENGQFFGEDYSLALCVDHILGTEAAPSPSVVVNLSTSLVIESVAKRHQASVYYTKIGEPYVSQGLRDHKGLVGGEGNGGVIYPKIGWGRDSLVGMVVGLRHLAMTKSPLSKIIGSYPKYWMHRDKFQVNSRDDIAGFLSQVESQFQGEKMDKQDGVKVILDNAWVHVRPSNTEPIVRLFIEASNESQLHALIEKVTHLAEV